MEAKDTVMNYELKLCHSLIGKYSLSAIKDVIDEECLAQAKISFRAGQEDVMKLTHPYFQVIAKHWFDVGKKAGIRKVVEWIRENISVDTSDGGILISGYAAGEKWQAKLKEWGI